MNRYLARLRGLNSEKPIPYEPSKPSKPTRVSTGGGFEGFEGARGIGFLKFSEALAELERGRPGYIEPDRWQRCVEDGRRFLAEWGDKADALEWTADELLGLHQPPASPHPSYDRLRRRDATGMLWGLRGCRVIALSSVEAVVTTPSGGTLTYHKRKGKRP